MDAFGNRVLSWIREQDMIPKGSGVLVGFSGGADSVCLLTLLCRLCGLLDIRVAALHVNHGLRGEEAARDEAFCRQQAARLSVPFYSVSVPVRQTAEAEGLSLEEAARLLRYQALEALRARLSAEYDRPFLTATAHHADDQAETILMNLFRGSGLSGLSGMEAKRGTLVRPLLFAGREEILSWNEKNGLSYVTDSSNLCEDYTRNFLRLRVLPLVSGEINRQAARHILSAGRICGAADAYLRAEADAFLSEFAEFGSGFLAIPRSALKEKAQIFRRYAIMKGLERLGIPLKDFGEKHYADLDKALFGGNGFHLDLPNGVKADNLLRKTVIRREES